jgi:hypothetical protein
LEKTKKKLMKRKRVCLSIRFIAIKDNEEEKKKLIHFKNSIGEPISYPSLKVKSIRIQYKPFEESVQGAYPIKPIPNINNLIFKAWVYKN